MRSYIEFNTKQRQKSKTKFEKDFFKLMNNSIYGKTLLNIRDYSDVILVKSVKKAEKLFAKPNYKSLTIFDENTIAIQMFKTRFVLNKPKQIGMTILDHSKVTMYNFHYNYIKPKFGSQAKLLFTDTDSLCYEIKDLDYYEAISKDIPEWFDTSEFNNPRLSCITLGLNKKVPGLFKDELCGGQITKFVGLRPKCYTFIDSYHSETKKAKGISKSVIQDELRFNDYLNCLLTGKEEHRKMRIIRSQKHELFTEEIDKIALSSNDDKRFILPDGISTLAFGHYKIKNLDRS